MTLERIALGRAVEERAAGWYRDQGYEVVDRNWRCSEGEIDLVAVRQRDRLVVFCEVKARTSTAFGTALEAVTASKQARLRRLAALWLAAHPSRGRGKVLRFDVAAVQGGVLEVVEGAF